MDLAYMDGSMGVALDSEEYEKFQNLHQAINVSSVDELIDILEMFPPHTSKESTIALRLLLKNAENEITQKILMGRQNVMRKRGKWTCYFIVLAEVSAEIVCTIKSEHLDISDFFLKRLKIRLQSSSCYFFRGEAMESFIFGLRR